MGKFLRLAGEGWQGGHGALGTSLLSAPQFHCLRPIRVQGVRPFLSCEATVEAPTQGSASPWMCLASCHSYSKNPSSGRGLSLALLSSCAAPHRQDWPSKESLAAGGPGPPRLWIRVPCSPHHSGLLSAQGLHLRPGPTPGNCEAWGGGMQSDDMFKSREIVPKKNEV